MADLNDPAYWPSGFAPSNPLLTNAALLTCIPQASIDGVLEHSGYYAINQTYDIPAHIRVIGKHQWHGGFMQEDFDKPHFNIVGGSSNPSEMGGMEHTRLYRPSKQTAARVTVPNVVMKDWISGYRFDQCQILDAGRGVHIKRGPSGQFPAGVKFNLCRFNAIGSGIYSEITNGLYVTTCNQNGGHWVNGAHVPYLDSALVEIAGEGADGIFMHGLNVGNQTGYGLLWCHPTSGNVASIDIIGGAADKAAYCGARIEGRVSTRKVRVEMEVWGSFGDLWNCGLLLEPFFDDAIRVGDVAIQADYLRGSLVSAASRGGPNQEYGSFTDFVFRRMRSTMGGRGSPGNLPVFQFGGCAGNYNRIEDCRWSGHSALVGGEGAQTNFTVGTSWPMPAY